MDRTIIDKWVEIEMRKCPQTILERIGKNTVRQQIAKEVELNLSYCDVDDLAKRIFDYSKIEGTSTEDYKYRHINTSLGEIITSIRFVGGDLSKPAVFLIYKEFELNRVKDIKQVGQIILEEYAVELQKQTVCL